MTIASLPWFLEFGSGPVLATAIHDGHAVRDDLIDRLAIDEADRLREEDPHTCEFTHVAPTRLVGLRSRFEVDLNRPRDKAVYMSPEDAWGLRVWKESLPTAMVAKSLAVYDAFYQEVQALMEEMLRRHGHVVVLDFHSYNHRRDGTEAPAADPRENPEINVGTGNLDRRRWASIVDRVIVDLRTHDFLGRGLDVRENVRFRGGHFGKWLHEAFPGRVCVLSMEVKKIFMNEWTGKADPVVLQALVRAFRSTIWGIHEELVRLQLREEGAHA